MADTATLTRKLLVVETFGWLCFAAAAACSAARYTIQKWKHGRLHCEDYIHIFSLVQLTGLNISAFLGDTSGLAEDPDGTLGLLAIIWGASTSANVFYVTTVYSVKAVFLALYVRIFGASRGFRLLWWLSVVFTTCAGLIAFMSQFWNCGDIRRISDAYACQYDTALSARFRGAIIMLACNVSSDLVIFSIPFGMFYRLQMSRSKKLRLTPVFLLGLVTILFDVVTWITQLYPNDLTASEVGVAFQAVQPSIAVIVACLPTLLFAGSKMRHSQGGGGGGDGGGPGMLEAGRRGGRGTNRGRSGVGSNAMSIQDRWLRAGRHERRHPSSVGLSQVYSPVHDSFVPKNAAATAAAAAPVVDGEYGTQSPTVSIHQGQPNRLKSYATASSAPGEDLAKRAQSLV